jgi:hypothetical protein
MDGKAPAQGAQAPEERNRWRGGIFMFLHSKKT